MAVAPAKSRLQGLDAMRGLCALAVVLGHVELPPGGDGRLATLFRLAFHVLSNGPAAVIVFFVVSGLCIHLPQAGGRALDVPIFYGRRLVRIGVPMAGGWLVARLCGAGSEFGGVLWSLVAELVYYALYPVLLSIRLRWGWTPLFATSLAGALALLTTNPGAMEYPAFGYGLTWVLGLPIWMMGCLIAESVVRSPAARTRSPWLLRLLLVVGSLGAILLRWHFGPRHVGYPWTLTVFGVIAWKWLEAELAWFRAHPPRPWMDLVGASSYSLYLVHVSVISLGWAGQSHWNLPQPLFRIGLVVASLLAAWLFHLAVERPSHHLAGRIRRGG